MYISYINENNNETIESKKESIPKWKYEIEFLKEKLVRVSKNHAVDKCFTEK